MVLTRSVTVGASASNILNHPHFPSGNVAGGVLVLLRHGIASQRKRRAACPAFFCPAAASFGLK